MKSMKTFFLVLLTFLTCSNPVLAQLGWGGTTGGGGGSGTVTQVSGTANQISVATGTTTPVISLTNTTVTAGSYLNASITVDAQGRLTAATSGTAPVTSITGTANQITVTGTTTPTLSLPYDLRIDSAGAGSNLITIGSTGHTSTAGSLIIYGLAPSVQLFDGGGTVNFWASGNANRTYITAATPTGTRSCTLPDSNSNTVIPDAGASHNFLTAISSGGVISKAQPAASDVSGLATSATTDATNASNITSGTLPLARLTGTITTNELSATAGIVGTQLANNTVGVSQINTNLIQYADTSLSSTQIKNLKVGNAPVQVVAAPGAGKTVFVYAWVIRYTYGTVQYAAGNNLFLRYANSIQISNSTGQAMLQAASNGVCSGAPTSWTGNSGGSDNQAVQLTSNTTDFTTGDGTAVIRVYYAIF